MENKTYTIKELQEEMKKGDLTEGKMVKLLKEFERTAVALENRIKIVQQIEIKLHLASLKNLKGFIGLNHKKEDLQELLTKGINRLEKELKND